MDNLVTYLLKYKYILFLPILLILLIVFSLFTNTSTVPSTSNNPTPTDVSRNRAHTTENLFVTSTYPQKNAINIPTNELTISINTNKKLSSSSDFKLNITPALPYYWKIQDNFPSTTVNANVYGGLTKNTLYTVTFKDNTGNMLYSWSFTTDNQDQTSASNLMQDQEQIYRQKFYPLLNFLPYTTADYSVDYSNKLTLQITILGKDVGDPINPDEARNQVISWIKSHNVDPSTHTITIVNNASTNP